jgi:hypothetical protein
LQIRPKWLEVDGDSPDAICHGARRARTVDHVRHHAHFIRRHRSTREHPGHGRQHGPYPWQHWGDQRLCHGVDDRVGVAKRDRVGVAKRDRVGVAKRDRVGVAEHESAGCVGDHQRLDGVIRLRQRFGIDVGKRVGVRGVGLEHCSWLNYSK